ncbi:MAG TPA: tetratricopeptide repeat protein, partial [Acidimicrobiia bacterium]|nr:tetratricopeptide repeat protein [Acidimicrobiia bacterium]
TNEHQTNEHQVTEPRTTKPQTPETRVRPGTRTLIGGVVLGVAMAAALVAVGQFRQARAEDRALSGVGGGPVDPAAVSNETMEAVIAANLDNPEVTGMRLALANRYFEEGDYQDAFPHYQAVLDGEPSAGQAATAYARLGWMVFDGNGEVDLAVSLLDQALALVPGDPFGLYLKGRVVWCGQGQATAAASLFDQVLATPGLDPEVREQVETDLAAAGAGETCP